jgi:hypothetical protein
MARAVYEEKLTSNRLTVEHIIPRTEWLSNTFSLEQKNLEHIYFEQMVPRTGALEHMSIYDRRHVEVAK